MTREFTGEIPDDPTPQHSELTPDQLSFIDRFHGLVPSVAQKIFKHPAEMPEDFEEAISDGYFGLITAARNFDLSKQGKDTTTGSQYVWRSISGAIVNGMRSRRGREYSTPEEAKNGIKKDSVSSLKLSVLEGTATSFSAPVGPDETDNTLGEAIEDVQGARDVENRIILADVVEKLQMFHPRDRKVYFLYHFAEHDQYEIAAEVGISQMQVSRILRKISREIQDSYSEDAEAA